MSALTRLHLHSACRDGPLTPRCNELARLHSTSLEDFSVFLDQVLKLEA